VFISARGFYYWKSEIADMDAGLTKEPQLRSPPPNKITVAEKKEIVAVLLKAEWVDFSPREIYYKLIDEEQRIIASISTFYRVARKENLLGNRRAPSSGKKLNRETPHLLAVKANEVWSWDVSQIQSTQRLERYYLYVIIDIWSRFVVGWCLELHEKTDHAIALWKKSLEIQAISGHGLVNHKDNGSIMTADEMIKFVRDAQMVDSYSRAGVSDDNPFSESLFRTIKFFRDFPASFACIESGRLYFEQYFKEYNFTYKHSGIQFLEPAVRHYGEEGLILRQRNQIIDEFHRANPHRYSASPKIFSPIIEVRIN
jgi:transposase InsO family protein